MKECLFCGTIDFILENELAGAFFDKYPVNEGHLLVIPKVHRQDFFELSSDEKKAIDALLLAGKAYLEEYYRPDGFNIGCNCGLAAGQSVMHCHIHLIPRYEGDMTEPKGGVRGVIPEKQSY